jgi:hypothetical protein
MSWYYAENNERRGPIEDAAFDALVRAGTVRPPTLVWREGMPNWVAYSASGHVLGEAPGAVPPPSSVGGVEMGVCSESGRILPRSELVEIDGKLVSAEYKNLVLQRIREGVGSGGGEDAEMIAQRIEATGWSISATSCVGRGFGVVRENFWLCVGATFLMYLMILASIITIVGPIFIVGPLFGGLYWLLLKLIRREPASLGDAFQGFNRGGWHLVGVLIVSTILGMLCSIPGLIMSVAAAARPDTSLKVIAGILRLLGMLVSIYLSVGWTFAVLLVVDKGLEFWPAMQLSMRVVRMHWWQIFGILFLSFLIVFGFVAVVFGIGAGLIAFSISQQNGALGIAVGLVLGLVTLLGFPALVSIMFGAFAAAYEDIFKPKSVL